MFMFGLVMVCQGLVSSWGGLVTTRFFLGVFETGMFPGCKYILVHRSQYFTWQYPWSCLEGFYLMGMWYTRKEAQKRFTFFFSSTTLAGAFGGLLATGLGQMSGLRGYSGWRWIFIIEGVLTCVVSLFWFFIIPDFPEDVKWLSDEERVYLNAKLTEDVGPSARYQPLTVRDTLHTFKDCKWGEFTTHRPFTFPFISLYFGRGRICLQCRLNLRQTKFLLAVLCISVWLFQLTVRFCLTLYLVDWESNQG